MKRELARALGVRVGDYTPEGSHAKILRDLADLIDRPTTSVGANGQAAPAAPTAAATTGALPRTEMPATAPTAARGVRHADRT